MGTQVVRPLCSDGPADASALRVVRQNVMRQESLCNQQRSQSQETKRST
jgi:hypothetical protein